MHPTMTPPRSTVDKPAQYTPTPGTAPAPRPAWRWVYTAQGRADTPLGPVTLAVTDLGLAGLWFDDQAHHPGQLPAPRHDAHPLLQSARLALQAYGAAATPAGWAHGLPLDPQGTPFQRVVWQALADIGSGQTRSYADVAQRIGRPSAVRAVAAAIGRNPVSIFIPCHRVLGRDGSLTGYTGGLARKAALLKHEGARHEGVAVRA